MAVVGEGVKRRVGALLSSLAASWSSDGQGGLTSNDPHVFSTESALIQILDSSGTLTESEFRQCATKAIRAAIKSGEPSVKRLEEEFKVAVSTLTQSRLKRFYYSTRLYVSAPFEFWLPIEVLGIRLVLSRHLSGHLRADSFFATGHGNVDPHEPDGGIYCVGEVSARSGFAALDIAAEQLSIVLGALNFWLNLHVIGGMRIGKAEVAAPLPSGGQIVLYDEAGNLDKESFSYYTHVNHRVKPISASTVDNLSKINTLISSLSRRINDNKFYCNSFRRYFESINEVDSDSQIVGLWTLAECITFSEGRKSQVIAERLAVTWSDREFVSAVCFAAGHRRNMVIHGPMRGVRLGEVADQFRVLVEQYLWRSLATNIDGVDHWEALIDLMTSGADLGQLEKALPLAKQLRGP